MILFRFFLPSTSVEQEKSNNEIVITKNSDVHHIANVLRLRIGDEIEVVSNETVNTCKIIDINKQKIVTQIVAEKPINPDIKSTPQINLFLALIKPAKFELACEKCTEIGINSITPMLAQHSQFKLDVYSKKLQRFNKICEVASKQSQRLAIPKVNPPILLKQLNVNPNSLNIIFDNSDQSSHDTIKFSNYQEFNYFIGPEAGWGNNDHEIFKTIPSSIKISLEGNILRAETASIVGLVIIKMQSKQWIINY